MWQEDCQNHLVLIKISPEKAQDVKKFTIIKTVGKLLTKLYFIWTLENISSARMFMTIRKQER